MIDLRNAISCIKAMKENGTYEGQRIGRVAKRCSGTIIVYEPGNIVLFKEEKIGGRETLTIESPLCEKGLQASREKESPITTVGTIVGVPKNFIEEIIFPDGYLDRTS